jgi:uncharacterized protein (DUF1330 family)
MLGLVSAYLHIHINVTDPDRYSRYQELAPASMKAYGARLLAKAKHPEVLEGEASHPVSVLLEFDDVAAAKRWYASPEYAEAIEARRGAATFVTTLLPGV